jgi:hypothetical protein
MADINNDTQQAGSLRPDPALHRLDPLVGTWAMSGHFVGSDEQSITGEATFQWLEGGFFLQQDTRIGGTRS